MNKINNSQFSILNFQLIAAFLLLLVSSCDVIPENERIVEMEKVVPLKKVLLLDFTDQACPNCPKAGVEVNTLKDSYGSDFVPVTIHASLRTLPLITADGNTYDVHFKTRDAGHPAGVIDGKMQPDFYKWGGDVLARFNVVSSLNILLSTEYDSSSRELKITSDIEALKNISGAKMLIWIIEDNIVAQQIVDNTTDPDYLHRHIFRAAVNSVWGEALELNVGETKTAEHSFTLDAAWKPDDISVVAFVYDVATDVVYDVQETKISDN